MREFVQFEFVTEDESLPVFRTTESLPKPCRIDYSVPAIIVRAGLPEREEARLIAAAVSFAALARRRSFRSLPFVGSVD